MAEINTLALGMDSSGFVDGVESVEKGIHRMEEGTRSGFYRMGAIIGDGANRIKDFSREAKNAQDAVKGYGEKTGKTAIELMSFNTAMALNSEYLGRMQQRLPTFVQSMGLLDERFTCLDRSAVAAAGGIRLVAEEQDRADEGARQFAVAATAAGFAIQEIAKSADLADPKMRDMPKTMDAWTKSWERMAQTLQSNLTDVFSDVLGGAELSFDGIAQAWKRMAANMLSEAVVNQFKNFFAKAAQAGTEAGTSGTRLKAGASGASGGFASMFSGTSAFPYVAAGMAGSQGMSEAQQGNWGGALTQGGIAGTAAIPYVGPYISMLLGMSESQNGGVSAFNRSLSNSRYGGAIAGSLLGMLTGPLTGDPTGIFGSTLGAFLGFGFMDSVPGLNKLFEPKETPGVVTSIQGGEWDIARRGGSEWPVSITRSIKAGILTFGQDFSELFSSEFGDVLKNSNWEFKSDAETYAGVVNETIANFLVDNWSTLFDGGSFLDQTMKGDGNIFQKFQRPDEEWSAAVIRLIQTMQGFVTFIKDTDIVIKQLTANDQGLSAFQYAAGRMDERIGQLTGDIGEFANESWERLDPTDVLERAEELKAGILERYELEKAYVEGLVARLRDLERASYEFNLRLQTKIDALTGSTDAVGIAVDRVRDLWAEFQDTGDFERQVTLLGELETGLDTILTMQTAVHQAEIDRLENVLAMLEQLRSASLSITEKVFSLTGRGEAGYAEQAGYYYGQALQAFQEYQGMNWGRPETLEDRIRLVQEMAGWLDKTVDAVMARWSAHYEALIASAQTEIDTLQVQKDDIQTQIGDLNEQRRAVQESYQTQMDAIEEQIRAAEQWKRLSESIADQILDMKLGWTNQQDIFERMDIARAEIQRVQGLYAGAGTDEERIGYAGQLQGLYGDLLNLGQEAWQRPSPEYQTLYEEVLGGLEGIQADADANAGDTTALQAELNQLTQDMNDQLKTIDDGIADLESSSKDIDQQISDYRDDIKGYEADKQAALDYIGAEAAAHYTYIQGEMASLLALQADVEADLASEQLALNTLQRDFANYYKDLKDAGSAIYQNQTAAVKKALQDVIGDRRTVEGYLEELAQFTGTHLQDINTTMEAIAQNMGITAYAEGGRAMYRQLAWVGEHEPESIVPFSKWPEIVQAVRAVREPPLRNGGSAGPVTMNVTVAPNVIVEGGSSASPKDTAEAVVDVCVRSVKEGRLGKAIKEEVRYWK